MSKYDHFLNNTLNTQLYRLLGKTLTKMTNKVAIESIKFSTSFEKIRPDAFHDAVYVVKLREEHAGRRPPYRGCVNVPRLNGA